MTEYPFCNMEDIFASPAGILRYSLGILLKITWEYSQRSKDFPCVIAWILTKGGGSEGGCQPGIVQFGICTVPRSAGGRVGAQNLLGLAALRSVVRQMAVVLGVWVGYVTEQADVQCRRLFDVSYISVKHRLNWWEHHFVCQAIKHQPMAPVDWERMGKQWREMADIKGDEGVRAIRFSLSGDMIERWPECETKKREQFFIFNCAVIVWHSQNSNRGLSF